MPESVSALSQPVDVWNNPGGSRTCQAFGIGGAMLSRAHCDHM
jgi:hypothetical protein